jgi:hypothetical protein
MTGRKFLQQVLDWLLCLPKEKSKVSHLNNLPKSNVEGAFFQFNPGLSTPVLPDK